jgi:hypothetical protein
MRGYHPHGYACHRPLLVAELVMSIVRDRQVRIAGSLWHRITSTPLGIVALEGVLWHVLFSVSMRRDVRWQSIANVMRRQRARCTLG